GLIALISELDSQLSQPRGQAFGTAMFRLGPLALGLDALPLDFDLVLRRLPLRDQFQVGGKGAAVGADDLQVVRTFAWLEPNLEPRADEPRHLGDLFQVSTDALPADEVTAVGIVDVILLDSIAVVEPELPLHLPGSIAR